MISFSCSNCGKQFRVSPYKGGKMARCPGCGTMLHIPSASGTRPAPPGVRPPAPLAGLINRPHYPRRHHRGGAQAGSPGLGRRRANMVFLAITLLIGFLMPIVTPTLVGREAKFVNLTVLTQEEQSWELKLLCLAPGIAGVTLLLLQGLAKHPVRGIVMIILASLPSIPLIVSFLSFLSNAEGNLPAAIPEPIMSALTDITCRLLLLFVSSFVGLVAILAGIRSRMYRPDSPVSYWFGVAGAAAWFGFLLLPVLPKEFGYVLLVLPLKIINKAGAGGVSMGLIVMIVCTIISAVICIANRPGPDMRKVVGQAGVAFWTLTVGFFVGILCMFSQFFGNFPLFLLFVKGLCWALGMYLLLPSGIADLIIGPPRRHHTHREPHETHGTHGEPPTHPDPHRRVV